MTIKEIRKDYIDELERQRYDHNSGIEARIDNIEYTLLKLLEIMTGQDD